MKRCGAQLCTLSACLLLLAACAGSPPADTLSLQQPARGPDDGARSALTTSSPGREKKFDCSGKRGRLQVAILQFQSGSKTAEPSGLSETLTSMFSGFVGKPSEINDNGNGLTLSRRDIEAANAELKANNCKAFDLEKELLPVAAP